MSLGSILLLVLAAGLLAAAVALSRARSRLPWPAIVVAALASAVCFTVGGDSSEDSSGPSIATVAGSLAGFLSVLAAIITLVPGRTRPADGPASRTPILLCLGGILLSAAGLLVTSLTR